MNLTLILVLAIGMIVACIGFIFLVLRGNDRPLPQDGVQWAVVVLSSMTVVTAGFLLAMALANEQKLETARGGLEMPAADFTFRLVGEEAVRSLAEYEGEVVLLNFWATWCQPCITELPELDSLQAAYGADGLVVITVSDEPLEEIMRYADLLPQETVSGYFEFDTLPEPYRTELARGRPISYVIDRTGYLRHYIVGAGSFSSFERQIRPYL